jgi:hypothetical protein
MRELLDLDVSRALRQVPAQIIRQRRAIKFFTGTDRKGIGFKSHGSQGVRISGLQLIAPLPVV